MKGEDFVGFPFVTIILRIMLSHFLFIDTINALYSSLNVDGRLLGNNLPRLA